MKKYYFIGVALLAAAVSCSKTESNDNGVELDPNAPVEVRFSAPTISVVSKAVNPETNLVEGTSAAGLEIGVYGLAAEEGNLVWNDADETTYITDLVNRNVTISDDGTITFQDPVCYYPVSNEKTFSFYGYYPYSADAQSATDACTATYDLTQGNVDILWAASHATALDGSVNPVGATGFNAAYIRRLLAVDANHPYLPSLNFQHKLTALKFIASTYPGEGTEGAEMQVVGFELQEVATQVKLTVASSATDDCGKVEAAGMGTLAATGADGAPLAVTPTEEGADIRTFTLLPNTTYKAVITISRDGIPQEPVTVDVTTTQTQGTFVAGTIYTMNVRIKSPLEVKIFTTSVEEWTEVDGGNIDL